MPTLSLFPDQYQSRTCPRSKTRTPATRSADRSCCLMSSSTHARVARRSSAIWPAGPPSSLLIWWPRSRRTACRDISAASCPPAKSCFPHTFSTGVAYHGDHPRHVFTDSVFYVVVQKPASRYCRFGLSRSLPH